MIIEPILKLANKRNIITKYGKISDLHKVTIEWFKHESSSVFMYEFVNYIINNYDNFKTYK